MPRLPDISQERRPTPIGAGGGVASYRVNTDIATSAARDIQVAGGQLIATGKTLDREFERIDDGIAEDAYNKVQQKELDLAFGEEGYLRLRGGAATDQETISGYKQQLDDEINSIAGNLKNDRQRKFFAKRADIARMRHQESLLRHVVQQGEVQANDIYENTFESSNATAAANYNNPNIVAGEEARIRATVNARADRLGWTEVQAEAEMKKRVSGLHESVAKRTMAASPSEALKYLAKHEADMDPVAYASLEMSARTRAVELASRAEALGDKQRKKAQEALYGDLTIKILEEPGSVDVATLNQHLRKRELTREHYDDLRKVLQAGDVISEDNPEAVLYLDRLAAVGDETFTPELHRLLASQQITGNTAGELNRRYLASVEEGGVLAKESVKSARRHVDQVIGGVRGPLAILDTAVSERVSNALMDFDSRVKAEPGKSPEVIANEIIKDYRLTPPGPTSFQRPKFLVGSRAQPDIPATMQATIDALDRGEISKEYAAQEIELINAIANSLAEKEKRNQ